MILIIGGAFQGKKEYAKKTFGLKEEEFVDGACCGEEELCQAKAVFHLHEFVRRNLKEGRDRKIRRSSFCAMSWEAAWCLWKPLTGNGGRPQAVSAAAWPRRQRKCTGWSAGSGW